MVLNERKKEKNHDHTKYMRNEIYMGIYYEKIDYTGFTWGFIWGRVFYMGKPHVIKIYMVIYHTVHILYSMGIFHTNFTATGRAFAGRST